MRKFGPQRFFLNWSIRVYPNLQTFFCYTFRITIQPSKNMFLMQFHVDSPVIRNLDFICLVIFWTLCYKIVELFGDSFDRALSNSFHLTAPHVCHYYNVKYKDETKYLLLILSRSVEICRGGKFSLYLQWMILEIFKIEQQSGLVLKRFHADFSWTMEKISGTTQVHNYVCGRELRRQQNGFVA